ncbi:MAG: SDR family oxidoreductase, partial [Martelella sp.]
VFNTSRVTKGKLDRTLYSATKGAAQSMARTWALELGSAGITGNCVAPGPIATTAFWQNNPPDAPKTKAITDAIPVGRMGTPEDVANAVSFFCDARASFVTGQTLFVCGGVTVG